ncbi:MAG: VWA domain-containing protein [Planctomycetota bacterium]|jgi:uncharacterized protein with von Willebrand factor type A (vWA) domain|nr:VWA domain-containing protein [Planctomycetota bacterium]MDP7252674.1 VWA domain-containing protein [Planctomycetota bacterium]
MKWRYTEWDGTQEFELHKSNELFDMLADFIMSSGMDIEDILENYDIDLSELEDEGFLSESQGKTVISSKGLKRMEERALLEIFNKLKSENKGSHQVEEKGRSHERTDETRPYEFGDPLSNIDMFGTLQSALKRGGPKLPIDIEEEDFQIFEAEAQASCSSVLMIDLSGSMGRFGKYLMCKKVALALQSLIQSYFPQDRLYFVVFYSAAEQLRLTQLPYLMPKPVSIFDPQVYLRIKREDFCEYKNRLPLHFTNIQAGLSIARRLLSKDSAVNKQIIMISDGEPTAHWENNVLNLIYPPSDRTAQQTLKEVKACTAAGIIINTFMLIDDWYYFGLKNFVDQMTRLNKGRAFYPSADELGRLVLDDYVQRRKKMI